MTPKSFSRLLFMPWDISLPPWSSPLFSVGKKKKKKKRVRYFLTLLTKRKERKRKEYENLHGSESFLLCSEASLAFRRESGSLPCIFMALLLAFGNESLSLFLAHLHHSLTLTSCLRAHIFLSSLFFTYRLHLPPPQHSSSSSHNSSP